MFTEILRGLKGLKGLRGLEGLSQQERDAWRRANASKLEGKSAQYEDRLYANQQFVKKFGMDAFNSFNKDQRDYIYKNTIVNELYTDLYSPYTDKVGTDGKYIVDPNKGMGSEAEFKKYYAMDADSKLELIRSGWKPTPQIESELKKERDMKLATISNSNAWVGAPNYAQGAVTASFIFREPIHEELSRSENNKILEGIYARDLKKREEELQPEIDDYYLNTIGKLSDSEVKSQFMKALTPSDTNIGNSQLLAFFHDGKNVEDEVKNFSIDDMRMYLAKFKVLNDRLGADAAYTALNNYAKEYISDHQGKLTYAGLLAKDIGIGILSYTADKVNGMRQLLNTGKKSVVWIDNKGNVVAPDQVRTAKNGDKYYINDDGKVTAIKQTKMSVTDLDYLGKDAEGNTRSDFLNNQFWADAEQYGTLDSDEIKQYKKLGASPYKVVYKPGDDSDLLYDTIKMTSFAIADAASMLIPGYGETVGAAMQTTKAASLLGKVISTLGKGIYYTSKLAKAAQPTISATAIGHAYGRGVFGEALTQNMQQLEEYAYTFAQKNFHDNYYSNKQFKDQVDKDVQTEFNKLKNIQKAELNTSEGDKEIANQELTDEALMEKAKQIVSSTYIDRGVKDIQNSDDYFDMVGKASESASDAAMTAAITDGAKYILVNNFGYRKFLFNTAADRAASSARRLARNLSEKESRRLLFKSLIDGKKLKTIGKITASQAWGGAWTNFTDEMQSWGGKQINQDRFSSYLSGFYNGQASDDIYGAIDAVTSYFNGAMASLAKGTTWKAGLVGATGSLTSFAPNVASIATTIGTKRGREAWRKASLGERANMIFNNGVLNEYYGKKQGESEIKRYVDIVNKLLDEQDNFSILKSAVALDRASIDVSNQEDKNAITYLKAVNAISLLHQFQNDSGIKDQSSSRIKRWLKNKFGEGENTLGAVASQSTILTKALSEIEDLANGNLSEESAKNYLSEYYAKNPTVEQSEDNNKRALEEMSQNAKTLQEAENTWQDINSKLDMVEKDRGSKISSNVRSRLLERAALDSFLSERLDALEDKISGNRINTSTESTAETWGTKEAIKKQVLSMERTERDLNKNIIAAKNRLDSATTKLNEYKKIHDIENLDDIATTEYIGLLNSVEAAKLQYEYTVNSMDKLKSRQEKMKAMSKEESSRVLSKDEILVLPSEARARMLNDLNRSNYSKEQLEQIDALKNELTLKDPSLLQSIQDQARLLKQKNANASAYEMMLENPEAAYTEFEAQDGVDATVSRDLFFRRYSESINNVIRKLSNLSNIKGVSQDNIREAIYKNLRVLHPKILDYLDTTLPNEKDLEFIPLYSNEIVKAKEWSNMLTDISKAVDQMNFDDSTKKAFSDNIGNLIDKASTRKQAMDILEQVSNSTNVSNSDQANFRKLLNIINGVEEQRNATTTETKEEKRARQESQETQAKQEEKRVKDAEDKAQEAIEVTEKEASNDKNAQEAYQETEKEKSNKQNAQEAYTETEQERRNQEEANRQLHTYEQTDEDIARDKAIEEQRKEGVDFSSGTIDFESPDWEKQVEQAEAEGHKIEEGFIPKGTADITDQGNNFTSTSENMLGNTMYGYDVKALEEDAKEVERTGRNPNDKMSRFFNWFKTANIKLQEIIDNELRDIIKANSKLEILYVNPQANATDDAALNDFSLLSVEYTDAVKKVHNEDRGGVITAGGKQYLIVGTMGFDRNNSAQGDTYRSILYQGKKNRYKYFTENPSERFYVDPSGHTEVEQITSGRIVREMLGDTETKTRPITELLSEPNRNPKGLKLQDLKWGIMFEDGLHYANVSPRNTVYPPRDTLSNLGAVFLLVEATNGNYIPAAIRPTMLSDLQDGALKTQLNNLFNELSSTKYSDRKSAINQLVKLLNIKEEGDNILIGMNDKATVSTVKNDTVLRTFNLKDANFSRMDLINAIFELNPRVNITLSTLSDPVQLKMYAEAGALNTDIAKLGTSNASYTVYSMDANGNPIKTKPIENRDPSTEANSDLNKADYKKKHSVYYRGSQYREKNGKWYDTNWKEVTDPILLSQIKWTSYIRVNDLTPNLVGNDMFGNKNNKYYIINSNPTNAKVIKVLSNGIVAELNINDSRVIIEKVQNRDIQVAREKAAKEEKERLMHIENSMNYDNAKATGEGEDVTEVNEISGANLTEEQIVAQGNGDFQLDSKPQPTDTELKAQAMVDRITTDTHSITLDSKRGIYTDSTGKEYARVTSVIQATKDAERFDLNSPWAVPSTNIGTGIDNFVRDFFANKLGNVDNLDERYPNADITQLKSFLKQLEGLKEKFDKARLTVVPRDVTVTGEVEVTDTNGKKYKLPVAGTLDLLAYDKEGNFYIFDMKTNRSVPNEKKVTKWDKQLSLYKQFLETKYGISVKGTSIIPIEVKYPIPKGWGNGKTVYRADEKTNQLYYQTEDNSGALTSSTPYRDAKPILHSNIPISTSPVKIEYSLLTDSEKALLSPVVDGTFNSSTGTTNIESKNKNKDINKTGDISLAELQASTNAKPTDVSSMLKNRNYSKKVRGILKEKGFNGKMSEVEAWLKEHNMPISNIKDIDSWIDMLQNCR